MFDLEEIYEAEAAIQKTLHLISEIQKDISGTKLWGYLDLFGGGFFISLLKRNKIKKINEKLNILEQELANTQRELNDVEMFVDLQLPDSFADNFFDIACDNVFTDISTISMLDDAEHKLQKVNQLMSELQQALHQKSIELL